MAKQVIINKLRCPQNHVCPSVEACPEKALTQKSAFALPVIDAAKCTSCEKCVIACPIGAIEVKN